jgi:1,2-diacylglycerol 3-beta-glucosyltransferase
MVVAVEIALLVIFGFFLSYLALLSALALTARKRCTMKVSRFRRMAVIVPAHDEELTIERTLRSLLALEYPRECFDVIVVADNCTDKTAEIARSFGVMVHERQNLSLCGKGHALQWYFDRLLAEQDAYDGFVVVDADSEVSRNFLTVMNFYLEQGALAVQASDLVKPHPKAWSSEVTRISFALYNYARPLGRRRMGCSAGLRGNGMCIAAETLHRVPWRAHSLSEDVEYGLMLILQGITVVFAPEGVVHATMPGNPDNAVTQRLRWEGGRLPLIRKYAGLLLWTALRRASFRAFDAFVDLVTPALMNLLTGVALLFLLSLLLWGIGVESTGQFAWLWMILAGVGVIHVIGGLYAAGADPLLYRALLYVPRYAIWKMILYGKFLKSEQNEEWIRTPRESHSVHDHQL